MRTKTLFCCIAAMTMALAGCKKAEPQTPVEELTITADKTEEYAGGFITVTSNKPIKSVEATDNLDITDFKLKVEQTDEKTIKVYPGSGSMKLTSGSAHIDSVIKLNVTDEDNQTQSLTLNGKSWYFEAKAGDAYGSTISLTDMKAGDKVYLSVKSAMGTDLSTAPGFSLSFEGNAYKIISSNNGAYICEIKAGASDYNIRASYKSRVLLTAPKSVSK